MGLYEYDNNLFQGLQLPEDLNREAVINEILLQCAELELLYPSIDTMKLAITTWSLANQYTWQKLYDTMVVEYNPIWNVDATVSIDRDATGTGNATDAVKGFNSNTWAESDKTDTSSTATEDVIERRTGNIGVVSTQSMIEQERKIAEFNMISYIAQSFKQRFCLLIY
jgi:hypothetical protein